MTKCTDFLRVHPVEEAFLATVAPGPHVAIIGKCYGVVLAHSDVCDNLLRQALNMLWLLEVHAIFVAMAKHSPISLTKRVKLAFFRDDCTMAQTNAEFLDVQGIVLRNSLRHTFGHLEVGRY